MNPSSPHYAALVEVAALIRTGELSPVEVARHVLDRIASVNPSLYAYLTVTDKTAIAEAKQAESEIRASRYRGPLHSVPIAIKDLFHICGAPSTFGSLTYRDFFADEDATAVHRLRVAGAVILGRLHLREGPSASIIPTCRSASTRGTTSIGRAALRPARGPPRRQASASRASAPTPAVRSAFLPLPMA